MKCPKCGAALVVHYHNGDLRDWLCPACGDRMVFAVRRAFAACLRAMTKAEKALKLAPANSWWEGNEDTDAYRAIKAARTLVAKAKEGVGRGD